MIENTQRSHIAEIIGQAIAELVPAGDAEG
jgi:hypothetical protein